MWYTTKRRVVPCRVLVRQPSIMSIIEVASTNPVLQEFFVEHGCDFPSSSSFGAFKEDVFVGFFLARAGLTIVVAMPNLLCPFNVVHVVHDHSLEKEFSSLSKVGPSDELPTLFPNKLCILASPSRI